MERRMVTRLALLALLFLTLSCLQASSIALAEVNNAPTTPSVPSGLTSGLSGTYYSYTTKATDPDGDKIKYTFDWGDGTTSTTCPVTQDLRIRLFHKWTVASGSNTFNVRVRVADTSGVTSSWSGPLSVIIKASDASSSNNPPVTPSVPSGSTSGSSGTSYSYSTKATDPDGDNVKYTFDWGDGTTSTTSFVSSGTSASKSHIWTVSAGLTKTFTVRAKAADDSEATSGWSSVLSVTIKGPVSSSFGNPPAKPSIPRGCIVGDTKYSYEYKTMAIDPDGDRVKYTFNWDDGTTTTTEYVASGTWASASHQWKGEPGTSKGFDITAKATDEDGKESAWSTALPVAMVTNSVNHPPTIPSVSGPNRGISGTTYMFSVVSNDPDGHKIKYFIHWGDGITETGYFPSGQAATASHAWNVPAGETKSYSVVAMSADLYNMISPSPRWSNPLVITITGPSISSQELGLNVEGNDAVAAYLDTEETNSTDEETNESELLDEGTNESDILDEESSETEPADEETNESELVNEETNETESADEELELVDEVIEEDCNSAVSAVDDVYSVVSAGDELRISAPGVLENDQYGSDKSLSVLSYTQPAHAADFAMNPDGSFTYISSQDYCGTDSFTYLATDGDCESNEAAVTILIDCDQENEKEVLY